jgi:hypothetical protein
MIWQFIPFGWAHWCIPDPHSPIHVTAYFEVLRTVLLLVSRKGTPEPCPVVSLALIATQGLRSTSGQIVTRSVSTSHPTTPYQLRTSNALFLRERPTLQINLLEKQVMVTNH